MKVLILTYGSTGDVLPYVALGQGLRARGHAVTICTNARFETLIRAYDLNYAFMSDDLTQLIESASGRKILENLTGFIGFITAITKLIKQLSGLLTDIMNDTWAAAQSSQPDVILFSPKNYSAIHFAEKLKVPAIAAPLFPQYVPTASFPTLGFPELSKSEWYNKMTYRLARKLSGGIGGKYIKKWRNENGLAPAFNGIDIMRDTSARPLSVINAYSQHLFPNPDDWPNCVHTVGFWFLDQEKSWTPPDELLSFLAAGAAPVYVGFGSMASSNAEGTTKIVIDALTRAGVRGIIATGWGGLKADELPDTFFKLDYAPHDWLFPHMAAVVHHGGAGTTAAGIRAGCPTLICPIFGDQPFWGKAVYTAGIGAAPIQLKKLTAQNLSAAIKVLVSNGTIKNNAKDLGEKIRAECGIDTAVRLIEQEVHIPAGQSHTINKCNLV